MNGNSEKSRSRSWLWYLLVLIFAIGFLAAIAIPNFSGSHTSELNAIVNNLRQIDAAKNQWAFERGFTNVAQLAQLTNQLNEHDLTPYLLLRTNLDGSYRGFAGEIYRINPLNKLPEATLTYMVETYPKDTIITLGGSNNWHEKYILPGQTNN
jgi:hypothetical protein